MTVTALRQPIRPGTWTLDPGRAGLTKMPNLMIARMLKITLNVTLRHVS